MTRGYLPSTITVQEFNNYCLRLRNLNEAIIIHNPSLLNKIRYDLRLENNSLQTDVESGQSKN